MPTRRLAIAAPLCALLACATHRAHVASDVGALDVVGRDELVASRASTVYEALMRVRPTLLWTRGQSSLLNAPRDGVLVFQTGVLLGGPEVLQSMPPSAVRCVRRLSPVQAYQRYGRRVAAAALEIVP